MVDIHRRGDLFMLMKSDKTVLDEIYRSCTMGAEAIETIISKVEDEKLALELNRQVCKYNSYAEKVTAELAHGHEVPKGQAKGKAMLWAGIQMNTLTNTSTEHIAELMIRGNTMAITDLMKVLKDNKDAGKEYVKLADELMDFEEKCIESLKAYLK